MQNSFQPSSRVLKSIYQHNHLHNNCDFSKYEYYRSRYITYLSEEKQINRELISEFGNLKSHIARLHQQIKEFDSSFHPLNHLYDIPTFEDYSLSDNIFQFNQEFVGRHVHTHVHEHHNAEAIVLELNRRADLLELNRRADLLETAKKIIKS
jgi:hypothetical protein